MVLLLKASGRRVASLTIIDSESPEGSHREYTDSDAFEQYVQMIELSIEQKLVIPTHLLQSRTETEEICLD